MSGGKFIKSPLGKILLRASFILLGAAVVAVGSVSYAKYVTSDEVKENSHVASMGIDLFELVEHGSAVESMKIDYTKVVPGANIPGPHVRLKVDAEVSYRLFVKYTLIGELPTYKFMEDGYEHEFETIGIQFSDKWKYYMTYRYPEEDRVEVIYQYLDIFKPTEKYDYTAEGSGEIKVLQNDEIFVSQYYGKYDYPGQSYEQVAKFELTFEAYIRQVLEY